MPEPLITDAHTPPPAFAPADPWHVPPIPMRDLAARYSPAHGYATLATRPDQVRLGDVCDHSDGLLVVTEITLRHHTWTIGGYNPAAPPPRYWSLGSGQPPAAPPLVRHVTSQPRIRVRRPATAWPRLAGHAKTISTHNPVKRGMYTTVQGWTAACSCEWTGPEVHRGRGWAEEATARHRAQVITDATRADLGDLAAIEALENVLNDVLPWRWDHGAQAQLHGLTPHDALKRLAPWAVALGVEIEHMSATYSGDRDFLWVDSRASDNGPGLDIRAYPTPAG